MDKLGLYITNLMLIVNDGKQTSFVRKLALDKLKELSKDLSDFIFNWIDEIETLPESKNKKTYEEFWTCGICGDPTNEVDYDYLSDTDHLECVLKSEQNSKQLTLEL